MAEPERKMKRRRFVTLAAMSGAALLTSPLSRAAAAVTRAKTPPATLHAPSPAIRKEIATQQKSLSDQLKTIRGYALPPGSPMAFAFKPLRARRGGKP
jgi:hypothetical protein